MSALPVDALALEEKDGRVRFWVRVKPRASKSRVIGVAVGKLEVAVAAPPVDGAANDELVRTLAAALHVARTTIEILSGDASRNKWISVEGLSAEQMRDRLGST